MVLQSFSFCIPPTCPRESNRPTQKNHIIYAAQHQIRHKKINHRAGKKTNGESDNISHPSEYPKKNEKQKSPKKIESQGPQETVFEGDVFWDFFDEIVHSSFWFIKAHSDYLAYCHLVVNMTSAGYEKVERYRRFLLMQGVVGCSKWHGENLLAHYEYCSQADYEA